MTGTGDSDLFDVYTPAGVCIARGVGRSYLKTLPAGIYIAAGKKIIIE